VGALGPPGWGGIDSLGRARPPFLLHYLQHDAAASPPPSHRHPPPPPWRAALPAGSQFSDGFAGEMAFAGDMPMMGRPGSFAFVSRPYIWPPPWLICPAQQTRPDSVLLSYASLPAGTHTVTLKAVAATPGTFALPPVKAYATGGCTPGRQEVAACLGGRRWLHA